jgi:hypothetical protein
LLCQVTVSSAESLLPSSPPRTTAKHKVATTVGMTEGTTGPARTSFSSHGQTGEPDPQSQNKPTQLAPYIGIAIGATLFIFILIVIVIYRRYVCVGFEDMLIFVKFLFL